MNAYIADYLSHFKAWAETYVVILALWAAVIQAVGYFFYIRKIHSREVEPNPATWYMFSYGTAFLTWLEWDMIRNDLNAVGSGNLSTLILLLPIVCSSLSLYVAGLCWERRGFKGPRTLVSLGTLPFRMIRAVFVFFFKKHDEADGNEVRVAKFAFLIDIGLTVAYITVARAAEQQGISPNERMSLVGIFLIISNASTVVSFLPILHGAWHKPEKEHPLPWAIWTCAYALLGCTTIAEYGVDSLYMLYPVSNILLHGLMALIVTALQVLGKKAATPS